MPITERFQPFRVFRGPESPKSWKTSRSAPVLGLGGGSGARVRRPVGAAGSDRKLACVIGSPPAWLALSVPPATAAGSPYAFRHTWGSASGPVSRVRHKSPRGPVPWSCGVLLEREAGGPPDILGYCFSVAHTGTGPATSSQAGPSPAWVVAFRMVLTVVRFRRFIWTGFFLEVLPAFLGHGRSKESSQVRLLPARPRSRLGSGVPSGRHGWRLACVIVLSLPWPALSARLATLLRDARCFSAQTSHLVWSSIA